MSVVELASRTSFGLVVSLLWEPWANAFRVEVLHPDSGEQLSFPTTPEQAKGDFLHPFASWADALAPESARAA